MPRISITVTGDKALNRKLRRLAGPEQKRAVKAAAKVSLKPLLEEVKRTTPKRTGNLRKLIKIRAMARSRRMTGYRVTAAQAGKKGAFTGDAFYGGFLEYGWKTGKRGSPGRRRIPGRFWMKKAAKRKQRDVVRQYHRNLGQKIKEMATRN